MDARQRGARARGVARSPRKLHKSKVCYVMLCCICCIHVCILCLIERGSLFLSFSFSPMFLLLFHLFFIAPSYIAKVLTMRSHIYDEILYFLVEAWPLIVPLITFDESDNDFLILLLILLLLLILFLSLLSSFSICFLYLRNHFRFSPSLPLSISLCVCMCACAYVWVCA